MTCTQNKRKVVVALVSAISAYGSPLMNMSQGGFDPGQQATNPVDT